MFGIMADMFESFAVWRAPDGSPDGLFGSDAAYAEAGHIQAMLVKQSSDERQIAGADKLRERYTVVVPAGTSLSKNDALVRDSDGLALRVTSDTRDSAAPPASNVQIARCDAEGWVIPQ